MQPYRTIVQIAGPAGRWIDPPTPVASLACAADSPELFTAFRRSYPLRSAHESFVWLQIHSTVLLAALKAVFPAVGSLYEQRSEIDARAVYVKRKQLKQAAEDGEGAEGATTMGAAISVLVQYLEDEFAYVAESLATYPRGTVSWHLLWSLLEIGQELESVHEITGEKVALILDAWDYVQESTGRSLNLTCHYFQFAGTCYHRVETIRKIKEFQDLRKILSLPAYPLSADQKADLQERGRLYMQYAGHHANYRGFFFTRAFSGATRLLGDGQVILDPRSFRRENPALDHWGDEVNEVAGTKMPGPPSRGNTKPCSPPTAGETHLLPPSIHGFSLRIKRWGEFLISRLSPIEWRNESFSHLVIPNSYRRIIKALVTVHAGELKDQLMKDVVEGKGTGLVMALHGSPGTGKTLTAEAVAEHLRKLLYVVSAGELGTTAAVLESQLVSVFRLATTWSAVLLIDEADIFLTKRDPRDLERNALVGIFLRQLEYFSGVLILTTNCINQFDEAFLSRFAVVLRFDELDEASRATLWERFLLKATASSDLSTFDLGALASHRLNGRDIKHTVQTAQAVALMEKEPLAMSHLEEVLTVAKSGLMLQGA